MTDEVLWRFMVVAPPVCWPAIHLIDHGARGVEHDFVDEVQLAME
jgi:hypothetical protein